jgi:cytochrome P450
MSAERWKVPPGPAEPYCTDESLLTWIGRGFDRFGDIYRSRLYGTSVYVTRRPDHADHVLRQNWQYYSKGRTSKRIAFLLGNGLMASEGEFWISQRRMMQPTFRREALAPLCAVVAQATTTLLDRWMQAAESREPVNVTLDVSRSILSITLRAIFGADHPWIAPHFSVLSEQTVRDLEFVQTFGRLGEVIAEVILRRRERDATDPDILGMLMQAKSRASGQGMSDGQLVSEIKTLIVAGHETTASTIVWMWYELSQHSHVEAKLSNSLREIGKTSAVQPAGLAGCAYVRQIVEETLRMYPTGWLLTRRALADDQLGDYRVPLGTEVYLPLYFIQRNPAFWPQPDCFDPDRFAADPAHGRPMLALAPFSAGPRNCIGEHLARTELQFHLGMVASRLRLRHLGPTGPEYDAGVNLRTKDEMMMMPEIKVDS